MCNIFFRTKNIYAHNALIFLVQEFPNFNMKFSQFFCLSDWIILFEFLKAEFESLK